MNRKSQALVSLLFIFAMLLASCGPAAAPASKEINVLCTPQEEWCQGMKQEFEAKYGITVNYVRMSSGEALARIQAEKDNPQFDIWWGGPMDSFVAAKQEGLLEAVQLPQLQESARSEEIQGCRQLLGRHLRGQPGLLHQQELAGRRIPACQGARVVGRPAEAGVQGPDHGRPSVHLRHLLHRAGHRLADPRRAAGWEYIKKYAGQIAQYTKSGAAPAKFVGQGEAAVGIVFSHDIVNEIDNNKLPLVLTFPKEGTGYEIGGMGILKGAKHLDAAKKWFDWALTAEAQALGPKYKAYQAPTVTGVELSHPELLQVNLIDYDFQWAGDQQEGVRRQVHQRDRRGRQAEVVGIADLHTAGERGRLSRKKPGFSDLPRPVRLPGEARHGRLRHPAASRRGDRVAVSG